MSEAPGTTRDSTDTIILRDGKPFCLVDTAGIRKFSGASDSREKAGIIRAKANILAADVICLVLDIRDFPTRQDAHIAHLAQESGKPLIIVLNKWDLADADKVDAGQIKELVQTKLSFVDMRPPDLRFGPDRPARGQDPGHGRKSLSERAKKGRDGPPQRIPGMDQPRAPSEDKDGSKIKVKYMTQQGVLPPTFVLFGSRRTLSPAYEKSLIGLLREKLTFKGPRSGFFCQKADAGIPRPTGFS